MRALSHSLLCVLVAITLIPLHAQNASRDTLGWHVVKSGETLESITARYLGNARAWRDNWKLNPSLTNPHQLRPGDRIRVIVARRLPARSADVRAVSRIVERQPTPRPWLRAAPGDRLEPSHGLRTREKSSAELGFADGASLILTENSLVFLRDAPIAPVTVPRDSIEVIDGQADVAMPRARKAAPDIEVIVAGASVKPRPTSTARARAGASRDAQFMVYGGDALVEAAGAQLVVPKGMGTRVLEGSAPGPLEKLLPAPQLLAPFQWNAVDGAERYTVEVCRDAACTTLVERASTTATSWSPHGLPIAELFWRVTAVAPSQLDGFPSAAAKFMNHLTVTGSIAEETTGARFANVRVLLYREGNDAPAAETKTDARGRYTLPVERGAAYFVVVDSRTIGTAGWAEQTSAPAGGWCDDGRGQVVERAIAGACYGGKRGPVADDARRLETSEHLARIIPDENGVADADFRFRFDVVTHIGDGGQGSLRQFIANANAIPGPNAMRFVPAERANAGTWWSIALKSPLPPLTDASTTIDGTARGFANEILDLDRGMINDRVPVGPAGTILMATDRPELEIRADGLAAAIATRAPAAVQNVAILGATHNLEITADATIDNVVTGAHPDGSPSATPGATGIVVAGRAYATLHRVYIAVHERHGLSVTSATGDARVFGQHLEVRGATHLQSDRSAILYSLLSDGITIETGSNDWVNVIDQCTILGSGGSARITGNVMRGSGE